MKQPWMEYKFSTAERTKIINVEDWFCEHEDEIGPRIVYLESLNHELEQRNIRLGRFIMDWLGRELNMADVCPNTISIKDLLPIQKME